MDLLDDITSLMTKIDKERPVVKGKKTTKEKQQEAPAATLATPLSGFRILKKVATSSHPTSSPEGGSSFTAERSSSMTGGSTKRLQEFEVDSKGGGEFIAPQRMKIELNGVIIDLSRAPEYVERYHISINKVRENQTKDLTEGPKLSFATEQRRRVAFAIFRQLALENSVHFGTNIRKHVYDNGNTFYSTGCTISDEESFEMRTKELASNFARQHLRCAKLAITVKYTGKVRIKNLKEDNDKGALREVCRFFEVLTSQWLYEHKCHYFGNKFYQRSEEGDKKLGEGKVVKSGLQKNVRLLNMDGELVPVLQIDTKKSPFYTAQPVLAFIQECGEGRNPEETMKIAKFRERVARELRGLVVVTTHLDNNRRFYIHCLSEMSATDQTFETTEGRISVEEYYFLAHKCRLRFPHYPLAIEQRGTKGYNFYPLEVLSIEAGQRVTDKKATAAFTEKMIQETRMLPQDLRQNNIRQLRLANLNKGDNKYLMAFGVHISGDFVTSDAKILAAPEITYRSDSLQPDRSGRLHWRLNEQSQFYRPATIETVSIVIFDRAVGNDQALDFYHAVARMGRSRGMTFQETNLKPRHMYSELISRIEEHFKSIAGKVSLAIFVTKMKKDPIHDFIKLLETRHNVITQHVCTNTVVACCQNRTRIIENVLLKMNVKCGGLNHVVLPSAVALGNRTSQRDMDGRIFGGKMFVGFELSHPAAQSLYDRQNNKPLKEPTVIGFAYSTGLPTDYTGRWWYQKPRLSNIQYIKNYFGAAFTNYFNQNKSLPTEIIVYRSGVSEGEFSQVEEEANEIRAAADFMRKMNNGKNYRPRITVIVAQDQKIIPASLTRERDHNLKASQANVPSGTCLEVDFVSPRFKEFIMASQQPNIGTSRPVRYTIVVEDEPKKSVSEAEHMTHFLCHGHQQSVRPLKIPAVLYAAGNLAKRGRSAWMTKHSADFDEKGTMSPLRVSLTVDETEDEFYMRISRELMNSLPNHYFA